MDTPPESWELSELLARYELEPTLKDIFVEGNSDHAVLGWVLDQAGRTDVNVYPISLVVIPEQSYAKTGVPAHSNKSKLIIVSNELEPQAKKAQLHVRCLVDADFDRHLGTLRHSKVLVYTDYCSMESYLFCKDCLDRFTRLVLRGLPLSAPRLLKEMRSVLERVFLIRLANETLGWGMRLIDIASYVKIGTSSISFQEERFIKNCLLTNRRTRAITEFNATIKSLESKLFDDPRHNIRGHDFTYLLLRVVKKHKGRRPAFGDLETFERTLWGCADCDGLASETLFAQLTSL